MTHALSQDFIADWLIAACTALGLAPQGAGSDFFDIGGTSMMAIKLIAKIEDRFGEDILPPMDIFILRRLDAIAAALGDNLAQAAQQELADADA